MNEPLDGWDADLERLLDEERDRGPLPTDASNRIRRHVMTSVGVAAGVGIATGAASASAKAATSLASAGATATMTSSSVVAGATAVVAPKVIVTVAAAILVGGASGAIVMDVLTPSTAPVQVTTTRVVDEGASTHSLRARGVAPPAEVPSDEPDVVAEVPAIEARESAVETLPVVRPASRDHDLASERELVAQARGALSLRRFQDALDLLDQHRRKFGRGRLAEERDGLRVSVLVMLGRHDAARDAAQNFHARYPQSIFATGVNQAIASIQ